MTLPFDEKNQSESTATSREAIIGIAAVQRETWEKRMRKEILEPDHFFSPPNDPTPIGFWAKIRIFKNDWISRFSRCWKILTDNEDEELD